MARIKLKIGENELEVDSRDFYIDNQTLGEIMIVFLNICQKIKQKLYMSKIYSYVKSKYNIHRTWFGMFR